MLWLVLVLGSTGLLLLVAALPLARGLAGRGRKRGYDPGALAHLLRLGGMILIAAAALARPHNPHTAAFAPPPGAYQERAGR